MSVFDFLFGEQSESYQLPWQTYGPNAYLNYQQQQNQAFYDWANLYNQQAANLYSQAQSTADDLFGRARQSYESSLGHYNKAIDQVWTGLSSELGQWDNAISLLEEQRDAGYSAVDMEYGQQRDDVVDQANKARGSAAVQSARTGLSLIHI